MHRAVASKGLNVGAVLDPAEAPFYPDDAFVAALQVGDDAAATLLFRRYGAYVRSLLVRVLGPGPDVADLIHDVFVEAYSSVRALRSAESLKGWLATITVHVARAHIRKKRRRAWLRFLPSEEVPEVAAAPVDDEAQAVVKATYEVLAKLPPDERIPFTLRVLEGMDLADVASACNVSLATVKRRLGRAEERFFRLGAAVPALRPWIEGVRP